jgi:hypothetical protein
VRIYKGLQAAAIGSFLAVNVGPGHATQYISSEQQFGPAVAPGIDRQTNFWRGGGLVEFDRRDRASNPTSGGRYAAQYVRYLATDLGRYSFLRLDLDASQYVPLFNRTHVIALHGASSLTTTGANQSVPFFLQPTLGGPDTLRGILHSVIAPPGLSRLRTAAVVRHFRDVPIDGAEIQKCPVVEKVREGEIDAAQIGLIHRGAEFGSCREFAVPQVVARVSRADGEAPAR